MLFVGALLVALGGNASSADEQVSVSESLGLEVPAGFEVSLFADDSLAHNIYSLAIDSRARVVVSGPGYVRRLMDDDGDGRADRAETFADLPATGAQGMCFVGDDLICTGDGALLRLRDRDGDGTTDGEPERWTRLANSEHGAHQIVEGPDGWLYVVCGNDAGVSRAHVREANSPVQAPRCGAVLRISRDGQRMETLADGFRNPYDLAFNSAGQLFTVDSDGERDHHLPWYAPTRLFDIALGREHGWVHNGHQRSWNQPESFTDNVDRAAELGRGSPTGLVCYRHTSFPARYRDGLFSACWTLGRVYFLPLVPAGATYRSEPEIFLRTTGHVGFAPCDLDVGLQGELYVAIGGRHTRGGVFRIRYVGREEDAARPSSVGAAEMTLEDVLDAPQPLSSWSRARWEPAAERLGREAFFAAALDNDLSAERRVRAIEILVDRFGGMPLDMARAIAKDDDPVVVARVAWALGIAPEEEQAHAMSLLAALTAHRDPRVARAAWEGLAHQTALPRNLSPAPHWLSGLGSADRRVRTAAIACGERAGRVNFVETVQRVTREADAPSLPARVRLARLWIERPFAGFNRDWSELCFRTCREIFDQTTDAELRLEAVRLMQVGLGDVKLGEASAELAVGYEAAAREAVPEPLRQETSKSLAERFPTGHAELDRELARLLAMLAEEAPRLPAAIATRWTTESSVRDDVHYLMVMAQLPGPREPRVSEATAAALLALDARLEARGLFVSRNWPLRVEETFDRLAARDENLVAAMLAEPSFGRAAHSLFARRMRDEQLEAAARRMLEVAKAADHEDPATWSAELIDVLQRLPAAEVFPLLREQWDNLAVRDALVVALAREADPLDRERFVEALGSPQADVVERVAGALLQFDRPGSPQEIVQALVALRQFSLVAASASDNRALAGALGKASSPAFPRQRSVLTALLRHWTGADPTRATEAEEERAAEKRDVRELDDPREVLDRWMTWFAEKYPGDAASLLHTSTATFAAWQTRLVSLDWSAGNAERGARVFERTSCHRCHVGANRLGPDLASAADRLSRDDLFAAIVEPSRDVSPLYRTTLVATRDGNVYYGLVVYDSPEGLLLQTGADTTVRITGEELAARQASAQSLMPTGLLDALSDGDVADLYAYLKTLKPQ